jgi:hypothetical protein
MNFNFNYLFSILKSKLAVLEIIYVVGGLKPVARVAVKSQKIKYLEKYCKRYNLAITFSNSANVCLTDKNHKGFSHLFYTIPKNPFIGEVFAYVSKSSSLANKAKIADEEHNYQELGLLLGYPKCCIDFYGKSKNKLNDFVFSINNNTSKIKGNYKTNFCLRCFDISLIQHFPCSFNCKETVKLAERYETFLDKYFPEILKELKSNLKSVVFYSEKEITYSNKFEFDDLKENIIFTNPISSRDITINKKDNNNNNNIKIFNLKNNKKNIFYFE